MPCAPMWLRVNGRMKAVPTSRANVPTLKLVQHVDQPLRFALLLLLGHRRGFSTWRPKPLLKGGNGDKSANCLCQASGLVVSG